MNRRHFLTITALGALAACGNWKVDYPNNVAGIAAGWRVSKININVPAALTVSANNELDPNADIVWWENGKPYGRDTVKQILTTGVTAGSAPLKGPRAVRLEVTLIRFHGMTPQATETLNFSGVHNVQFYAQMFDANSGEALTEAAHIFADVPALHNQALQDSIARGATDRVRVTNSIAGAIAGWLGVGPDIRNNFTRLGS